MGDIADLPCNDGHEFRASFAGNTDITSINFNGMGTQVDASGDEARAKITAILGEPSGRVERGQTREGVVEGAAMMYTDKTGAQVLAALKSGGLISEGDAIEAGKTLNMHDATLAAKQCVFNDIATLTPEDAPSATVPNLRGAAAAGLSQG